ncbi:integrase arm-type DNA-binding domain-containing protein [Emcibacteraceae bacterium]|nr:integrase arm-type DNA-binding domain-containing protein [Emcibacteraceae bacterium]
MATKYKLSSNFVKTAPPGKYGDGAGLWLVKRDGGSGQWVLRVNIRGKRREMGLGSISTVTLKQAREKADEYRILAHNDIDPIAERKNQRRAAKQPDKNLETIAINAFEARKAELKGGGKNGRWYSPLKLHVLPKLGKIAVDEIDSTLIKNTLSPIWHKKADTALKAINRLNIVLSHAEAMGIDVNINATKKARILLGKQNHIVKNIPAMPWSEVPAFYQSLDELTVTHLALRLLILTGVRSCPIRFIHEDEIEGDIWTIPAENMKGARGKTKDFRVPLSIEALKVINSARAFERHGYLFSAARKGVISDATMSRHMQRRGMIERPHGFRSSLRTWIAEATDAPYEVAEEVLAHSIDNKVARAYKRTDYIEMRKTIMDYWAEFLTGTKHTEILRIR